ncbi:MAG: hypothetical protein IT238_00450 [Bacteroidia bacterium]|nr:hypothetical protein [Bacteroidia bacterium]MCZ2248822.1 DUF5819 family protein [Bacteroidia bacterium]
MNIYRKIVFIFFTFFLVFHLTNTFIFNFDKVTQNTRIKFWVFKYMFPFLNQNNKVFAPDPPFNSQKLLIRYRNDKGEWTAYQDLQADMIKQYNKNRLSPVGFQIKFYDYVLRHAYDAHIYTEYYLQNMDSTSKMNLDSLRYAYLNHYDGFRMAQRYFSDMIIKQEKEQKFDSLQFKINFHYPEKYNAQPLDKIKTTTLTINFPPLPVIDNYYPNHDKSKN